MNKTWLIIEKVIGVLIAVWGIIALYGLTIGVANMIRTGYVQGHISYFQLFVQDHLNFLLALFALFGGFMLMFNDKQGWLLSIITTALYVVTFFISSQTNAANISQPYYTFFKSYSLMALLFLLILIVLIQKPFWKKYKPTIKTWLWIIIIAALLFIDKMII